MASQRFTDWLANNGFEGFPESTGHLTARATAAADRDAFEFLRPDEVDGLYALYCWELRIPRVEFVAASDMDGPASRSLAGFVMGAAR